MVVRMSRKGTVTLPKEVREGLAEAVQFEVVKRPDGVIELRPRVTIDPDQAWFWTERWQKMEREVDGDYAAGRFTRYDNIGDLLADLEAEAKPE